MYLRLTQASIAPPRPVLVYDEGCPFCTATAYWLQAHARERIDLLGFNEVPGTGLLTSLNDIEARDAAHFITPYGAEYHAGEAVTRALRLVPRGRAAAVLDAPGLSYLRDLSYALVARARPLLSRFIHP